MPQLCQICCYQCQSTLVCLCCQVSALVTLYMSQEDAPTPSDLLLSVSINPCMFVLSGVCQICCYQCQSTLICLYCQVSALVTLYISQDDTPTPSDFFFISVSQPLYVCVVRCLPWSHCSVSESGGCPNSVRFVVISVNQPSYVCVVRCLSDLLLSVSINPHLFVLSGVCPGHAVHESGGHGCGIRRSHQCCQLVQETPGWFAQSF